MGFRVRILVIVTFSLFLFIPPGRGEIVDRIVAIVNDQIITLSELEQFRESFYRFTAKGNDWLDREYGLLDVRRHALNAMIDEKLIDQEAVRLKISVSQKQINDTIESLRRAQGLSQNQLETALKAQGISYEAYEQQVEKGLKRTRIVNRFVKSNVEIEEDDLKAYYERNSRNYMADRSVRISHILLPIPANATSEQEEEGISFAKEILKRVEDGEDFVALAHQYAQDVPGIKGGDLGYFKRGEMIAPIDRIAFELDVGEVGQPIRTEEGIILIKVTDSKGGSPIPLAEIREKVEKDYRNSRVEQQYRQWLRKLREKSFIEVKL